MSDAESVTLDILSEETARWLRARIAARSGGTPLGRGYQATVTRFDTPEGPVVVKSPHHSGLLGAPGRVTIRREHDVYARLHGIEGIPRCYALLDGLHLVLEHVPGPSLRAHARRIENPERFYARLLATIDSMHAAGVAHGDLKRKDNIVVGPDERPYLIDFGIACLDSPDGRGLGHRRFEYVRQLDYNAWVKLKYRRELGRMTPAEAARYRPLLLERASRWVRIPWQTVTLRRPRKRWKARRARNGR